MLARQKVSILSENIKKTKKPSNTKRVRQKQSNATTLFVNYIEL